MSEKLNEKETNRHRRTLSSYDYGSLLCDLWCNCRYGDGGEEIRKGNDEAIERALKNVLQEFNVILKTIRDHYCYSVYLCGCMCVYGLFVCMHIVQY